MSDRAHKEQIDVRSVATDTAGDAEYRTSDWPAFLLDDFGASYLRGYHDPSTDAPAVEWSAA